MLIFEIYSIYNMTIHQQWKLSNQCILCIEMAKDEVFCLSREWQFNNLEVTFSFYRHINCNVLFRILSISGWWLRIWVLAGLRLLKNWDLDSFGVDGVISMIRVFVLRLEPKGNFCNMSTRLLWKLDVRSGYIKVGLSRSVELFVTFSWI